MKIKRHTSGNVIHAPFAFLDNESLIRYYRERMEELALLPEAGPPDSALNYTLDWLEREIDDRYNTQRLTSFDIYRLGQTTINKAEKSSKKINLGVDEGPSAA